MVIGNIPVSSMEVQQKYKTERDKNLVYTTLNEVFNDYDDVLPASIFSTSMSGTIDNIYKYFYNRTDANTISRLQSKQMNIHLTLVPILKYYMDVSDFLYGEEDPANLIRNSQVILYIDNVYQIDISRHYFTVGQRGITYIPFNSIVALGLEGGIKNRDTNPIPTTAFPPPIGVNTI
jgi:hypothetical protein